MNQSQVKYTMKRIEEIKQRLLALIDKKDYTVPAVVFSAEKRLKLFNEGKFKIVLSENDNKNVFHSSNRWLDFQNVVLIDGEKKEQFNQKAYELARSKVIKEAAKISDELMLGDHQKVLVMLTKFENMQVK